MKTANKPLQSAKSFLCTPQIFFTSIAIIKINWQRLIRVLSASNELQVWKRDRQGHTYWHAYDPLTGNSTCLSSEAEMRIWIEQHYYRGN